MNDAVSAALLDAFVQLFLVPLAVAGAAWAFTKLPGPAREWLQSGTHQRDVELVVGAMTRRALAGAGKSATLNEAVADVIAYTNTALPEVVGKLNPSRDALATMAKAAIQRAVAEVGTAATEAR